MGMAILKHEITGKHGEGLAKNTKENINLHKSKRIRRNNIS